MGKKLDRKIDEIIENMDFERIRLTMISLDWTWRDAEVSPTTKELRKNAKQSLCAAWNNGKEKKSKRGFHESGGFRSERIGDWLQLSFVVESYEHDEDSE